MATLKEIYNSWLRRTKDITEDCSYCNNQRYHFHAPIVISDNSRIEKPTLKACPSCNWNDLQLNKESDYHPLHLFVEIKRGNKSISILK